jgi:outer membrane protein OmpA-like peptidoglycan-associated protein
MTPPTLLRSGTTALALVVIAGCASGPTLPARVNQVRSQYQTALGDAKLAQHASVPLYEARQAVEQMERASTAQEDEERVETLAYVAERRLQIAQNRADQNLAASRMTELNQARDTLQLEARTREAEEARAQLAHAQRLSKESRGLGARSDARGIVLTLDSVLFSTGKADLKPGAERVIGRIASLLNAYPDRGILVEGHTDSVGSDEVNLELSRARADAVARALATDGVSRDRIRARGFGESQPIAGNDTPSGRQQNRRVEIVIAQPSGEAAPDTQP